MSVKLTTLHKIRTKIVLLMLAFGIVPAAIVFGILETQGPDIKEKLANEITGTSNAVNDVIDRNLFERYGDVQAFGLNAAATDPANWSNPSSDNVLVRAMDGYMTGYGIYKLMLLVAPDGKVLAVNSVDGKGGALKTASLYQRSFKDAAWLKSALAGDFLKGRNGLTGTVVVQPHSDKTLSELYGDDGFVMTFAAPVKDSTGNTVAVWANFAGFGVVEEIVATFQDGLVKKGKATAEITVLDSTGKVLVDYDPAGQGFSGYSQYKRNFEVIGKLNLAANGVEAAKRAVAGESGSIVSLHVRKKILQAAGFSKSVGVYDYPGLGWSVLVREPVHETFALWDNLEFVIMITMAAVVAAILVGGFFVGSSFAKPLQAMTTVMTRLADGDKTVEIPAKDRKDEIGEMAATVQVFKDNMIETERLQEEQRLAEERAREEEKRREAEAAAEAERARQQRRQEMLDLADGFEGAVGSVLEIVAAAAEEMQASAKALTSTAEQTSGKSASVAAASEQATVNVQTVAAAAEELSTSVQEISRQVAQSSKIAQTAVRNADTTNAKVKGLAEAASKIGDVIGLINDIASQTNLLALNATIEAARAGEAGKGFAVVATEVKSLADQTSKATEEIGAQIGAMQAATDEAVTAIAEISGTITEINEIATAIASAVEEQGMSTQEIAANVQQAAAGTRDVSDNISAVSEAAGETGAAATQVLNGSEQLASEADHLRTAVHDFLAKVRAA